MTNWLNSGGMVVLIIFLIVLGNRVLWIGLQKKMPTIPCIALSSGLVYGLLLLSLFLAEWLTPAKMITQWHQDFETSLTTTLQLYEQLGWKSQEMEQAGRLVRIFFKDASFAWLAIMVLVLTSMSYFVQRKLVPQLDREQPSLLTIERWRAPHQLIWLTMVGLLLTVAGSNWLQLPWVYLIGINISVLLAVFYSLIGIGIAFFYINYKKWPPLSKVALILLVALLPMGLFLVVVIGISDTWWDWRTAMTSSK